MIPNLDTASRDWYAIEEWAKAKLAALRKENDHIAKNEIATAYLRGKIAATRELIALGTPPTQEPSADNAGA